MRQRREFFTIAPERIQSALRLAELEDVTPREEVFETADDQAALDRARAQRGGFNFEMVKVPEGAVLTFVKDPEITAAVLDKRRIEFDGEATSLSKAVLKVVHRMGYDWKTIAGPSYWEYEGETLAERRLRMEVED